jgi:uncharacterized SAM-binding protein YcdF (DUF218 family)
MWLRAGPRWFRIGWKVAAGVLALLVLYVGGTFFQVWQASRDDQAQPAGAILVMGAAQYDGDPSPVFEARLQHAADLYAEGLAETVVVTGGRQVGDRFNEAQAGEMWLLEHGVPEAAVLLETDGRNSWESLAASARFLHDDGIDDVIIVSDPYHSKRLLEIADEVDLDAFVSPTDDSPVTGFRELRAMVRETVAVSIGRLIGYRRLMNLDDSVRNTGG